MSKNTETKLVLCESQEEYEAYAKALTVNTKVFTFVTITDTVCNNKREKSEDQGLFRIDIF